MLSHCVRAITIGVSITAGLFAVVFNVHAQWQEPSASPPQGLPPGFVWLQGTTSTAQSGNIHLQGDLAVQNAIGRLDVSLPDSTYAQLVTTQPWMLLQPSANAVGSGGVYVYGASLYVDTVPGSSGFGSVNSSGTLRLGGNDIELYAGGARRVLVSGAATPTHRVDVVGSLNATELCIAGTCQTTWPSGGASGTFVQLQSSSPGTADTGNFTITGTGRAGKMEIIGDGTGTQANFNAPVRDVYMDVNGNIQIRLDADNNGTAPHEFSIVNGDNTATVFWVDEEGNVALQKDLLASGDVRGARLCIGVDCRNSWGGGGTVSSVGLAMPAPVFAVSGSPVTGSGTLTATWNSQNPNLVLAGPASGAAAEPTFRNLVAADIPTIPITQTSGTLGVNRGGTGVITVDAGDLLYGTIPSDGNWSKLTGNTTTTKQFLSQTGNGTASAAPVWSAITASDLPGVAFLGNSQSFTGVNTFTSVPSGPGALQGTIVLNPATADSVTSDGDGIDVLFGAAVGGSGRLWVDAEGDIWHGTFDGVFNLRGTKDVAINLDADDATDGVTAVNTFRVVDGSAAPVERFSVTETGVVTTTSSLSSGIIFNVRSGATPTTRLSVNALGDVMVVGKVLAGREQRTASCTVAAEVRGACSVTCSTSNHMVFGGGCDSNVADAAITTRSSAPMTSGTGWACDMYNGTTGVMTLTVTAICARLAP